MSAFQTAFDLRRRAALMAAGVDPNIIPATPEQSAAKRAEAIRARRQAQAPQSPQATMPAAQPPNQPAATPRAAQEQIDFRMGLRNARQGLREARMNGMTGDALSPYEQRVAFYQQGLATENRARNLERLEGVDQVAAGRALDKQLPDAMVAGNASSTEAAMRRLAAQQRYGLPSGGTVDRLLALSQEPLAPANPNQFAEAGAARMGRDYAGEAAAMRMRLQQMSKPQDVSALEARGGMTPEAYNNQRIALAMQERAIAEQRAAEAAALGTTVDGLTVNKTPMQEEQATQDARTMVGAVPQLNALAYNGLNALSLLAQGDGSARTVEAVNAFWKQVQSLPEPQRQAMVRAVLSELNAQGINIEQLRGDYPGRQGTGVSMLDQFGNTLAGGGGNNLIMNQPATIAALNSYRYLMGG